ncbi:nuclease SbcCD subunit C [Clostridium sp. DMHC 10]|uniref:AAA family ATPase n=1 Tax=Clostridium sp. DMHC 10 TaxID=747377 RepID=UPI00069CC696|nr:AAA family ATPase [Clostridium sp. DMHC 10]KOF56061.1 nuclease SbcCD subunit C [Clostridium sp. DMHC 10]
MKPIKLKIKGLNSFIETQEIDFEKLTEKGLFGIFGPTGSGKSSILDGITLALYGEVARKSSNYMNTNCSSLNVSYEFRISGSEVKRYVVDREFRRDNRTGSVRSKSAKIVDITDGAENILEEGAKLVTEKCEEIIGLKLEDFTRTVVLPQGKFSEFLKLEGKDRRNMLERLFNLQKYGDELSYKLMSKIKAERQKSNVLEGQFKGYEDISEEKLEEINKKLSESKENCEIYKKELKTAEEKFNEARELWQLQHEFKANTLKQEELKKKEPEIKEKQIKVIKGESALKVKPYIDSYEKTIQDIKNSNNKIESLKNKIVIIKENKQKISESFNYISEKKDRELPELSVKKQKVIDAIAEKSILDRLLNEKIALEKEANNLENSAQKTEKDIDDNKAAMDKTASTIGRGEKKLEELKISEDYKKKVNEGIVILNDYKNGFKRKSSLVKDIETAKLTIENSNKKSEILSKSIKEKDETLNTIKTKLEKINANCPGNQDTLLNLQIKLAEVKDKWNKYEEYSKSLNKSAENIGSFKEKLSKSKLQKELIENNIKEFEEAIHKIETENLAQTLRKNLIDGEPCPVCGAVHHITENIKIVDLGKLEEFKNNLENSKSQYESLNSEIIKLEANIKIEEENSQGYKERINLLGEEFKAYSVSEIEGEFKKLKDELEKFNAEKAELEGKLNLLNKEKNSLEIEYSREVTIKSENDAQLEKLNGELETVSKEVEETQTKLQFLKDELNIDDFNEKNKEILEKEKERAKVEEILKKLRNNLNLMQEKKESLNNNLGKLKEKLSENKTAVLERNKNIEEKQASIISKVGNETNLEGLQIQIDEAIKLITENYRAVEKQKNEIEEQYNECNNDIVSVQSNLTNLTSRSLNDKENLNKVLEEEKFEDVLEVKNSIMRKIEIEKLKLEIEEYKNVVLKLSGALENLKNKISGRNLTEETWLEIQNARLEKESKLKEFEAAAVKFQEEVKRINEKLTELKELVKQRQELDHKLSLLDDLEKLFKGKKFVEFVAANQLKYISIEASKRLEEITCGNYGLEVDDNGKFIIRDYKNGGAERDASTLSGGETFVTSLALALALSAQIQLKGTAPLELFFLDEGFGTLDDNLLEVVMDSLEKIHNDKLSIGLISHLETIKERMPVKLIVSPAEAGMGGSKVRIETN